MVRERKMKWVNEQLYVECCEFAQKSPSLVVPPLPASWTNKIKFWLILLSRHVYMDLLNNFFVKLNTKTFLELRFVLSKDTKEPNLLL